MLYASLSLIAILASVSGNILPFELRDVEISKELLVHEIPAIQKERSESVVKEYNEWVANGMPKRPLRSEMAMIESHDHDHAHDHDHDHSHGDDGDTSGVQHVCQHDELDAFQYKSRGYVSYGKKDHRGSTNRRRLANEETFQPIRITPYWDYIEARESSSDVNWIKQVTSATIRSFEKFMRVKRVIGPNYYPSSCASGWRIGDYFNCASGNYRTGLTCGAITVPANHYGPEIEYSSYGQAASSVNIENGVRDSDFILYVSADNGQCGGSTLAYAGPCAFDEYNRPIAGHVNWCDYALQNQDWIADTEVGLHEILHALIMSFSTFGKFVDSNGNPVGESNVVEQDQNGQYWLKAPKTKQAAIEHYGCNTVRGVALENNGGSGTALSHWEERWAFGLIMNGVQYRVKSFRTKFLLALMEDSGWYQVDWSYASPYHFGEGGTCSFINGQCIQANGEAAFGGEWNCDGNGDNGCDASNDISGYCTGGLSNGCSIRSGYSNYEFCYSSNGANSKCFDFKTNGGSRQSTCGDVTCNNYNANQGTWASLTITYNGGTVTCYPGDKMNEKSLSNGYTVKCPDVNSICDTARPFQCLHGFWNADDSECKCDVGFTGTTCSNEDSSIMSGTQDGTPLSGDNTVYISDSATGQLNGRYDYTQRYENMNAYRHSSNSGIFLWWSSWEHKWYLTSAIGNKGSVFGSCDNGDPWNVDVTNCQAGDWANDANMNANDNGQGPSPTKRPTRRPTFANAPTTKRPTNYPTTPAPTQGVDNGGDDGNGGGIESCSSCTASATFSYTLSPYDNYNAAYQATVGVARDAAADKYSGFSWNSNTRYSYQWGENSALIWTTTYSATVADQDARDSLYGYYQTSRFRAALKSELEAISGYQAGSLTVSAAYASADGGQAYNANGDESTSGGVEKVPLWLWILVGVGVGLFAFAVVFLCVRHRTKSKEMKRADSTSMIKKQSTYKAPLAASGSAGVEMEIEPHADERVY